MNGRLLEDLFSEHAKSINTAIAMDGVEAGGYIFLSVDNNVEMKVAPSERGLRYIEYSDRARHLRLDAPLIAYLAKVNKGWIMVDVPVNLVSPEVPPQLATLAMKVSAAQEGSADVVVEVVAATETWSYEFTGPVGLEDLLGAARDVLLLAETSDEMDCQGPHDVPYGGEPPVRHTRAMEVMATKYKLCRTCLANMADMGFPMAPPIPEGWE